MAKVQLDAVLKLVDVQINPAVFRKISQAVAGMPASLVNVNVQLKGAATNAGKLNQRLRQTKSTLSQNERAARLFLQRMAQFAILLPTFATLNRAIQGGVKFLFEFDSALRDIVRIDVTGLSSRMEEVGDAALRTAVKFGTTATEVLNVTRVFKQAGFTIEESQVKAQTAILATQVSTLKTAEATEVFIAAAKQFGKQGEDSADVLDKLAAVEDKAAVNASDLAGAFKTGGNALAFFGKDINAAVGLVSALREQTRKSGPEIGTFFKTIQTRIFAAGDARSAVEGLGVSVENLDGSLRPTLDVFNDMKAAFEGLTEAQAANAAKSIAGIRQFESLQATLRALDRANELTAVSHDAAGTAATKQAITDAKLERQLGKLIAQGQMLAESFGDAGIEDALKGALSLATQLLKLFTNLTDSIGDLGGNLAPLLALGGVQLGRSIFGVAGGKGGGGGGGGAQPGGAGFIGPLQKQTSGLRVVFKNLTGATTNLIKRERAMAFETRNVSGGLASFAKMNRAAALSIAADSSTVKAHSAALKANIAALKTASRPQGKGAGVFGKGEAGLLALSIAAGTILPKAFDGLEKKARKLDGALGESAGTAVNVVGSATTMAASFAFLGPQAAAIAGIFGALTSAGGGLLTAFDEHKKALEEDAALLERESRIKLGSKTLTNTDAFGTAALDSLFDSLVKNIEDVDTKQLPAALQASLDEAANSTVFRNLKISSDELRESLFTGTKVIGSVVAKNIEYLTILAENKDRTGELAQLTQGLTDGTLDAGHAMALLTKVLGAGQVKLNEFAAGFERVLDFGEFKAAQETIDFADSIRVLGLELELAQLGPEALSDSLVKLQNEFAVAQTASKLTQDSLREGLNASIKNLLDSGIGQGIGPKKRFRDIVTDLLNVPGDISQASVDELKTIVRQIPDNQRDAAEEVLKIIEKQVQDRLKLQNLENDVITETNNRRKAMLEAEATATHNAFAATQKFNAELAKFGSSVSTDVLSTFQNASLGDVNAVLSGTSDLGAGVQELIRNAFGGPVVEAQGELAAVASDTQAELNILSKELELVEMKLGDQANAADFAALTAQKHAIALSMEEAKRQATIQSTDAKIKVLEAEKDAADDAAEAERERQNLLEKLADAARSFDQELKDIQRSFDEFTKQKTADLLQEEAGARSDLKDAQQDVLDTTASLAEAYDALIKAQLEFNGAIAEAQIKSNMLSRDIAALTGEMFTFDAGLSSISNAFRDVLGDANITLGKRIELERQLADETLAFLQQARDEIVQAGVGVFGQTGAENQALGQGIQGLQFVADQLGGSFESFLSLTQGELSEVTGNLLSLPAEFRQEILSALSFLPSTTNIGGFSPEQLTQAIGQVGAGVDAEAGLPSIEELNNAQVEQLQKLQELALQDAQLQFSQVIAAQEQLAAAEEAAEAAKLLEERASENLEAVRDAVLEEKAVLDLANDERRELLAAVVAADDKNTLMQIEREAQLFAEQNATFRDIGDTIVRGIQSAIGGRLATIEAAAAVNGAGGFLPNFAGGNLNPGEAAALLRAGAREKRAMPGGAGLAVANTSEAIIPMRNGGFIPNFQDGSDISAGISAIRGINETVVAAIARSVTAALTDLQSGGGNTEELLTEMIVQLNKLNSTNEDISSTNATVASNSQSATTGTATTAASATQRVEIVLQTNQNNTISITGLESLRDELEAAAQNAASQQVSAEIDVLLVQLEEIFVALQERGILSSFGQTR